ncbi:DNA-binding IclR family transcriptional regulator [Bacillus pakistanensis]|uniref:DNA-binding IclR family transcriptional regulator n=1 Tax=Rossellomorea pakistanensis TaxID=992288 RepID=A0ABS2NCL3_9BACI|nr:IclR family transcriptional regulator [Bacillus pakistanensis]MBM7585607.1 DNA-binding IclR family transcriptional regulator [Bacillus pakistanensis]
MQLLDRAMNVIKVLTRHDANQFLSITELAKECELPVSSMHRLLKAMMKHEMIQQDPEKKLYGLGNAWLEYGLKVYDTIDYVSIIRPELEKLMHLVKESVYLSKPIGMEALVIERIDCEQNTIRIHDQLGLRTPMNIGAGNLTMLAFMPLAQQEQIIDELVPQADKKSLYEMLGKIKLDGYKVSHDERTEGISTVAAPVLNRIGGVVGAVSVRLISYHLTEDKLGFFIDKVVNTGRTISMKLGYQN